MGRKLQNVTNSFDPSSIALLNALEQHNRIVMLTGEINEISVAQTIGQLTTLSQQDYTKPIYFMLNTYGGSLDDMFALYDTLKFIQCPVHTVGLGKIMSAGVLLLAAGNKGNRLLGKNARLMLHPVSTFLHGNIFQILNESDEINRLQTQLETCLTSETKMSIKEYKKLMKQGNDIYISPSDALKYGIVDKLI